MLCKFSGDAVDKISAVYGIIMVDTFVWKQSNQVRLPCGLLANGWNNDLLSMNPILLRVNFI